MAADIKTVMKMDNSEVEAKLKQLNKHFRSTYNDWVDATDEVVKIDKKLIGAKTALANASKENSKHIKANIALLQKQKNAIKATQMARKAEYASVKTGIQNIENDTKAKKTNKASTESSTNSIVRHIRQLESLVVAYYAITRGYQATVGIGLEVNRMMEDNTSGIAALLSANTQMVLSNGQMVNSYEKFQIGQQVATQTMEDLRKASVKTYATFPQLTEIFQQAIGQTLSMGDAFGSTVEEINQNTIKLSQRMSNIGGAIGQPMDRIREEIRSLLSGNASTDSLIATMIFGSPGEANKAVRDAKTRGKDGLTKMLDSMLEPFDILEDVDSYTRSLLQLEDAWSQTMAAMSEPIFEDLKVTFKELADDINENKDEITKTFNDIYETVKNITPELINAGIAIGAIKLAAKVNPFTAWAVAIAEVVIGLQKISEERFKQTQSAETKRLVGRTAGITSASPKGDIVSAQSTIQRQMNAFAMNINVGQNEEKVEALANEYMRLENILNGTTKALEAYNEQAKLVTKHSLQTDLVEEAIKGLEKSDPKIKSLQDTISKYNEAVVGFGKAWSEVTTEEAREDLMISINALMDGAEDKEKQISKIRLDAYQKRLKLEQELWVATQRAAGVEVKASEVAQFKIDALKEQLAAEDEINKRLTLRRKIQDQIYAKNQALAKEQKKKAKDLMPGKWAGAAQLVEDAEESFDWKNFQDNLASTTENSLISALQSGLDGDFDFGEFASGLTASIGQSFLSAAISSGNIYAGLGGIALMGISSLFGGDKGESGAETARKAFDSFMDGLDSASQALEKFGNVGTSISEQISALQEKKASYDGGLEVTGLKRYYSGFKARVKATYDGQTFRADNIGELFQKIEAYKAEQITLLESEFSNVIETSLADALDISALTPAQLESMTAGIDVEAMEAYETELNNIALAHKTGTATATDTARATEILSDAEFARWRNNAEAFDILTEANEEMISSLQSIFDSLQGTIDSLRGAAIGSEYSLNLYNQSMKESQALLAKGDMEAFEESVAKTQGLTSVLFDEATFAEYGRTADIQQRFAQSVAANQFEAMQTDIQTEIDILKLIEENTRTTSSVVASTGVPSFAVGTTNVSSDMTANIHRGEIIVPSSFSDGLRSGELSMGSNDAVVAELQEQNKLLRGIIANQKDQTKISDDSKNIQQATLNIAG